MLNEHEKFRMIDEAGKNDFFAEVNFDENEVHTDCKVIKFTFPDGKQCFVKREYLNEMLFAIGAPSDQKKMIPQTLETIHHYNTTIGIRAEKDISKGEMINLPISLSVACSALRQDIIGKVPEYKQSLNGMPIINIPKRGM